MWLKCSLYSKNCFSPYFRLFLRVFHLTSGYFLRAPDNSNFFRFPLKVRVIGSRPYLLNHWISFPSEIQCLFGRFVCFHIFQGRALKIFFDIISLIKSVTKIQVQMETCPIDGILYFQTCVIAISIDKSEFSWPFAKCIWELDFSTRFLVSATQNT